MDTTTKALELAKNLRENLNKLSDEDIALSLISFGLEVHKKECKKLPKEIIVQNLERRGKKIAHDNNIFKRKNWDNAVQVITENYK